jgi:hypothetical protein
LEVESDQTRLKSKQFIVNLAFFRNQKIKMNPNYTPNNNRFPSFTYADASSEMDLDFNILSDYLFNEEEEKKFPEWNISQEDLTTKAADSSFNDLEGEDEDDDDDDDDGEFFRLINFLFFNHQTFFRSFK